MKYNPLTISFRHLMKKIPVFSILLKKLSWPWLGGYRLNREYTRTLWYRMDQAARMPMQDYHHGLAVKVTMPY
jgi:hypothetical protein